MMDDQKILKLNLPPCHVSVKIYKDGKGYNPTTKHYRSIADIKELVELRKANAEFKKLLSLVKKDLLMRAEEDSDGCKVVNLSSFIWIKLKEALKAGN
jgi:hypothetical protein